MKYVISNNVNVNDSQDVDVGPTNNLVIDEDASKITVYLIN